MEGFNLEAEAGGIAELARERNLPLYEDLGSGCVVDLKAFGIDEPLVSDSLASRGQLSFVQRGQTSRGVLRRGFWRAMRNWWLG